MAFRYVLLHALSGFAINVILASTAPAAPIIQEVYYDADGPDAAGAFTELFGTPGEILDGWSLVGVNGGNGQTYRTIDLTGATVPTDGLLVIASTGASAALVALRDFTAEVDWQNGPDAVQLIDPAGIIVDALQYGDADLNNSGLGLWAPDAPAGSSLSRDALGTNTFDNAVDFLIGGPTPGQGPQLGAPVPPSPPSTPQPVAEPSTLLLSGAGLAVLSSLRRRRLGARS